MNMCSQTTRKPIFVMESCVVAAAARARDVAQADTSADACLDAHGLCLLRGACNEQVCEACLAEVLQGLQCMLSLPATLSSKPSGRQFLTVSTSPAFAPIQEPKHRSDFMLALSPPVEAVLKAALTGLAGSILEAALGRHAELCELSAITSEPGAASQAVHSDGTWSTSHSRLITMFLALHDILDETMGPTHFWADTHAPSCFPDGRWRPPSESRAAEMTPTWYALHGGDAVLMDSLTWHCGGANASDRKRTLLVVSFREAAAEIEMQMADAATDAVGTRRPKARESDEYFSMRPELRGTLRLSDFR